MGSTSQVQLLCTGIWHSTHASAGQVQSHIPHHSTIGAVRVTSVITDLHTSGVLQYIIVGTSSRPMTHGHGKHQQQMVTVASQACNSMAGNQGDKRVGSMCWFNIAMSR